VGLAIKAVGMFDVNLVYLTAIWNTSSHLVYFQPFRTITTITTTKIIIITITTKH
jgi:hypothetical protein